MSVKDVMEEYHKRYKNKTAPWNRFIDGYKKDDRWYYRIPNKQNVDFDDRNFRKMSKILEDEASVENKKGRWGGKSRRKTNRKTRRKTIKY